MCTRPYLRICLAKHENLSQVFFLLLLFFVFGKTQYFLTRICFTKYLRVVTYLTERKFCLLDLKFWKTILFLGSSCVLLVTIFTAAVILCVCNRRPFGKPLTYLHRSLLQRKECLVCCFCNKFKVLL